MYIKKSILERQRMSKVHIGGDLLCWMGYIEELHFEITPPFLDVVGEHLLLGDPAPLKCCFYIQPDPSLLKNALRTFSLLISQNFLSFLICLYGNNKSVHPCFHSPACPNLFGVEILHMCQSSQQLPEYIHRPRLAPQMFRFCKSHPACDLQEGELRLDSK